MRSYYSWWLRCDKDRCSDSRELLNAERPITSARDIL